MDDYDAVRQLRHALDGQTSSQLWGWRVEREAKEVKQWQARQRERQECGLPPEPKQDRERQRQERSLGR